MKKVRDHECEFFTEFWEQVWLPISRHTDGRGLARDAFRKHILNGADPQDIIDGARWFIRSMKERDREFVPLSATWLNREAYVDGAIRERAFQAAIQSTQAKQGEGRSNVHQMTGNTRFLREFQKQREE